MGSWGDADRFRADRRRQKQSRQAGDLPDGFAFEVQADLGILPAQKLMVAALLCNRAVPLG